MKVLADEPVYTINVLDRGVTVDDVIDDRIHEQTLAEKNAFFVADLGALMRQHVLWHSHMARVRPFYTVACNSSPVVIDVLAALGAAFVCASKSEVEQVLSYGVPPESIVCGAPCKQLSHVRHAAKTGVHLLVCDSETELRKIARCHPAARLLLQVATATAAEETSMPFGCTLKSCRHLLQCARELGLQVVGVKFHVPASCSSLQAYSHALSDARCVFDMGEEFGFDMKILDIGGGFSGSEGQLEQIASAIGPLLDLYFPALSGVHIMAEPGSYYVSSCFTLAVTIIGKKAVGQDQHGQPPDGMSPGNEPDFLYYMNDGVYGSFAIKLLEDTIPAPSVHKKSARGAEPLFVSSLWGPSCDGLDRVVERLLLPELSVGDWVIFSNMGTGSLGEPSSCTAIQKPPVYYIVTAEDWYEMQEAGINLDSTLNTLLVPYCF
ncbi:antizyme inhibitor 1b [Megalops cyprinoides]|uniref:antizyme inhibitor 1b n=1 Tax=Megalops cyprinoides TaxID=118141 RepID=UPI001864E668|nr:antizyme inhibitor 1b [Megalops cyprinoides]